MLCRFLTVWAFVFILPFVTAHWSRRHQEVGLRARGDVDIHKRQYYGNTRFTWYDVGLGACGQTNTPDQFIVALSVQNFGSGYPGPNCFKSIVIQVGDLTAQAMIVDECEACPEAGLDFSSGLFEYFAPLSEGVLTGGWWFGTTSSSVWEPPTTTSTPVYTPPPTTTTTSSVYVPPPTTTSTPAYTPPATSTTTSSTTSSTASLTTSLTKSSATSTSSTMFNTSWASGLAIPTGGAALTPDANDPQNILALYNTLVEFGVVLSIAEKSK